MLALLTVALVIVHVYRLDALAWYSARFALQGPPGQPAVDLSRYRVVVDARVIEGIEGDLSGLTYDSERRSLFGVLNHEPWVVELDLDGRLLRRIRVAGLHDLEAITHVSGDTFVITEERLQRLWVVDIPDGVVDIDLTGRPALTLGLDIRHNLGFEGLSYDDSRRRLLVVKEAAPRRVLAVSGFVEHRDGQPLDVHIEEVERPRSPRIFVADLSSVVAHDATGHMLLLSDASKLLIEYSMDGEPISVLPLWRGFRGLAASVPQPEGITMDDEGAIYIVSEPNLFYVFRPVQ